LNILYLDVFSFSLAEFLKWHQFASDAINGNGFCIQHEGLGIFLEALKGRVRNVNKDGA
jgi:hypothetical protein